MASTGRGCPPLIEKASLRVAADRGKLDLESVLRDYGGEPVASQPPRRRSFCMGSTSSGGANAMRPGAVLLRPGRGEQLGGIMTQKSSIIIGKLIISAVAVFTGAAPFFADWNSTHIYNPNWPPHAKFHNAQTIVLGAVTTLLAIWFLWKRGRDDGLRVDVGSIFSVLYWICLV